MNQEIEKDDGSYIRNSNGYLFIEFEWRSRIMDNEWTSKAVDILSLVMGVVPVRTSLVYLSRCELLLVTGIESELTTKS